MTRLSDFAQGIASGVRPEDAAEEIRRGDPRRLTPEELDGIRGRHVSDCEGAANAGVRVGSDIPALLSHIAALEVELGEARANLDAANAAIDEYLVHTYRVSRPLPDTKDDQ